MAKRVAGKGIMMRRLLNNKGNAINWFPGQMSSATRSIRHRLSLSHLVIQLRDSRIPVSSANLDLPEMISRKKQIIALNKKDLANPNMMHHWIHHFESSKQNCIPINSHSQSSVKKLLDLVELKLKEVISREPTLLVMVVGVPNVGKSALINSIHEIASQRFPGKDKRKRATVGPLPGVTQDITGFQIAHKPSIYIMDTPGVLAPSIPDLETGLKLALAGSVKDSVVGEERIAQYLLAILNTRSTPLHWKNLMKEKVDKIYDEYGDKHEYTIKDLLPNRRKPLDRSDVHYIEDLVTAVQRTLYTTFSEFDGNVEEETDLEHLIEQQFEALQRALKIPQKGSEARIMVSKKFLTLFRTGKLGPFILDDVPNSSDPTT